MPTVFNSSKLAGLSDGQGNEGRVGTYDNEDLAMKDEDDPWEGRDL